MAYRATDLPVPPDNPFEHDRLGRAPAVKFVAELLEKTGGPFVMALDAPWGTGKTTFVRMLEAELIRSGFACINFNAWQVDYVTDPLVALVSAIEQVDLKAGDKGAVFREGFKKVSRVTGLVAKRGAIATAKAITLGALELDAEIERLAAELAGGLTSDVVAAFQRERQLLETFRRELESAIGLLAKSEKKGTLIFIVDELDRCRPTFAIELLERIKHLFDVPNIIFLLALDKGQLEASAAKVYGERIDAVEYLRRFIDLEFSLPTPDMSAFTAALLDRFGMTEWFAGRTHPELRHDRANFVEFFTALANIFELSLRARERCMTRVQVVLDQTAEDHYLDPVLVALLVVLRVKVPSLFSSYCAGHASPADVMNALADQPGGAAFCEGDAGHILEAHLVAADPDRDRAEQFYKNLVQLREDDSAPQKERARASALLDLRRHIPGFRRGELPLKLIAAKIDLATHIER
ncbi:MAG: P-loop NTPase fold protein [Thermomicrobiales bacterium]